MLTSQSAWPPWTNQEIVLYHGTLLQHATKIAQHGVDTSFGAPNRDFGRGFYTTTLLNQAQDWADARASEENASPAIVRLILDRLELRNLRSLAFVRGARDAQDFWSFVCHCRRKNQGAPATHQYYDVVYGPVAKNWKGPRTVKIFRDFDQISFHGIDARNLLRDPHKCKVEILT
jgi:hypothetical protein